MFSVWSTESVTCKRNATSESSRLFFAIRMKRWLGAKPKPCNKCWVTVALKLELSWGLRLVKMLLVVARVLLKPTDRFVPHWKAWLYAKSTVPVFCINNGTENELLDF